MPDPGSPHTHPDDYPKLGLGSFEQANAAISDQRPPSDDPERDDQLREAISQRLEQHQFVDSSRIAVDVRNAAVTLEGLVDNRFAKERAEQLAREIEGLESVDNRIRIQSEHEATGGPVLTTHAPDAADEPSTQRS